MRQEHECVSLACRIRLGSQESLHQLWRIWDKMLELAVNSIHCEDGVLANI